MNKIQFLEYFFILSLLSSIFLPFLDLGGLGLYGTTILSFFLLPFLFYKTVQVNKYFFLISALVGCVLISTLYSAAIGFSSNTYRNYIEALKYAQFLPYIILARYLNFENYNQIFNRCLYIITCIYVLVFFVQYSNFLGLKDFLVNLYLGSSSAHAESVIMGWRLTITGSGPNEGGAIGVFLLLYHLINVMYKGNKFSLLFSVILVFAILTTQSRTAFIGMLVTILLIFALSNKIKLFKKIFIFSVISLLFVYLYSKMDLEYIKGGLDAFSENENNSINIRLDRSEIALELFQISPFFGVGPAKNELSTVIDSEYLLIIQRYGLLGVVVFSLFILNMLIDGFKNRNHQVGIILLSYTFFTLFVMSTNSAYSGYQLMSINVFLIISMFIIKKKTT